LKQFFHANITRILTGTASDHPGWPASGDHHMRLSYRSLLWICLLFLAPCYASASELFREAFDDGNLNARGWYDNSSPVLTTREAVSGRVLEFRYPKGSIKPISGNAMRKKFSATEAVYLRYQVKYSANWIGSGRNYHPHEFYLLTNKDGDWSGLAETNLTAYIEQTGGVPLVGIQDTSNVDQRRIGQNLATITELRGVAGCNGASDSHGAGNCYLNGSIYRNEKKWKTSRAYFTDSRGPYYKNDWHQVEVFLQLNSIVNGKAIADGIIQYWFDGERLIDQGNVVFRTGKHPDMKFNQLIIGPYIGDGSPVDQTTWFDNVVVGTARPAETPVPGTNKPPVANAGASQQVIVGSTVVMDGSASSDGDGDLLTYVWTLVSRPAGSLATLSRSTAIGPPFTADSAGIYVFSLVVNDGKSNSSSATVTVTASNAPVHPPKNLRIIR
jgi:hypothetical protein